MALSILDGNQSATTLSTILSSGQHITAHTVVSLGTQAITDMRSAVSGSVVSVSSLPAISGTVTANLGANSQQELENIVQESQYISGKLNSVTIGSLPAISGTVTANGGDFASTPLGAYPSKALRIGYADDEEYNAVGLASGGKPLPVVLYNTAQDAIGSSIGGSIPLVISGTVTIGSALPAGTNRIGVVTIGGGTVTIGAGTAQIGSVTVGNSITISSLPNVKIQGFNGAGGGQYIDIGVTESGAVAVVLDSALPAGTEQIGSVTASISGTVPISISSVTVGNSVTIGSLPAISGTVTANSSNGSLTTRFGSVTTANTAFATSAVTNTNRKYLLIQNVTTASNVITVGIGFTPTTTQGIQLSSGAGLTFEGSYIPTGAVNLLSSVTASCFTILEA